MAQQLSRAVLLCAAIMNLVSAEVSTIAFLLPYSLNDVEPGQTPNTNHIAVNVIANDAAAELAVEDFNAANPDNIFQIARKNIWDPEYSTNWSLIDSGGYSIIQTVNLTKTVNISAAFGDYLSSTTFFTAEILSYFAIPFCDGSNVLAGLKAYNITVQSQVYVTPQMQAMSDYSFPIESLKQSNSRYFFVCASANLTADFYYSARDSGITGSGVFVWMGINRPFTGDTSQQTALYGDSAITDLQGYLWLKNDIKGILSPSVLAFQNRWIKLNSLNSTKYPLSPQKTLPPFVRHSYDCVQVLMRGLVQGSLNQKKPILSLVQSKFYGLKQFMALNYSGLLYDPILLYPPGGSGSLWTPKLVISINASVMQQSDDFVDQAFAFARIGLSKSSYQVLSTPVFPGGSSIPPNDGSLPIIPVEKVIDPDSSLASTFQTLSIAGHATSGLFLMFFLAQKARKVPSHNLFFGLGIILGSEMVFSTIPFWAGRITAQSCVLQRFLLPIGFSTSFGSIFAKLHHTSTCLENKYERARGVSSWVILAGNAAIAAAYVPSATVLRIDASIISFHYVCSSTNADPNFTENLTYGLYIIAWILNLLDVLAKFAVLGGATMISIPFLSNDILLPQILRAIVSWLMAMATLIFVFGPNIMYAVLRQPDGTVIGTTDSTDELQVKSGIHSDDKFKIGALNLVNAGSVHYQVRTSLGWNDLRMAEMVIHSRKNLIGVTFVEDSGMVNTFTISKMYSEDYLNESWTVSTAGTASMAAVIGGGGATGSKSGADQKHSDSITGESDEGETEMDRILTIPTTTHSVRIVTETASQTLQIRQYIMGNREEKGSSIRSDAAASADETFKK
ncbi:hypothetical protein BDR26DRAFT_873818 [Obelidium mucronatum]|nr:hypothetical protein BDR26DRAFT_873818 [Obelidium mucronatum]